MPIWEVCGAGKLRAGGRREDAPQACVAEQGPARAALGGLRPLGS